jgi:hypothetical protein
MIFVFIFVRRRLLCPCGHAVASADLQNCPCAAVILLGVRYVSPYLPGGVLYAAKQVPLIDPN